MPAEMSIIPMTKGFAGVWHRDSAGRNRGEASESLSSPTMGNRQCMSWPRNGIIRIGTL